MNPGPENSSGIATAATTNRHNPDHYVSRTLLLPVGSFPLLVVDDIVNSYSSIAPNSVDLYSCPSSPCAPFTAQTAIARLPNTTVVVAAFQHFLPNGAVNINISRSIDNGLHWQPAAMIALNTSPGPFDFLALSAVSSEVAYFAAAIYGLPNLFIQRSVDAGATWTTEAIPLGSGPVQGVVLNRDFLCWSRGQSSPYHVRNPLPLPRLLFRHSPVSDERPFPPDVWIATVRDCLHEHQSQRLGVTNPTRRDVSAHPQRLCPPLQAGGRYGCSCFPQPPRHSLKCGPAHSFWRRADPDLPPLQLKAVHR